MNKYEYKTESFTIGRMMFSKDIDEMPLEEKLNELGRKSWDLLTKVDGQSEGWTNVIILIFKRRIISEN